MSYLFLTNRMRCDGHSIKNTPVIRDVRCGARGGVPPQEYLQDIKSKALQQLERFLWGERGSNPHDVSIDGF